MSHKMKMNEEPFNRMKKSVIRFLIFIIIIIVLLFFIFSVNIHKQDSDSNAGINIEPYISNVDKDNDGIDDQTDILNNVKEYIKTKPKYESKYYATGYPNDEYGVCTDVVANGLKGAGYDLMQLVNQDIKKNRKRYNIEKIDINIDFRRVKNLDIYFKNNNISLTTDLSKIEEWQGGDIIVMKDHIGIISDKRNKNGVPLLIHHQNPEQINYEEDVLELYGQDSIVGHYRIS